MELTNKDNQASEEKPISQAECARMLGFKRQYIGKLVNENKIPHYGDRKNVKYSEALHIIKTISQPGRDTQREWGEKQRQGFKSNVEWEGSSFYKNFGTLNKITTEQGELKLANEERRTRIESEKKKLELLEIEIAEKKRELIALEEVMEVNDRVAGEIRSALVSFGSKMAPNLEALKAADIKVKLDEEINNILIRLNGLGEGLN
jgi:hypothetical protein